MITMNINHIHPSKSSQESCAEHIIFLSTEQLWHCAMNTPRPKHNSLQLKLDLYWLTCSLAFVFWPKANLLSLNLKHETGSGDNQQPLNNLLRGFYHLTHNTKEMLLWQHPQVNSEDVRLLLQHNAISSHKSS